MLTGADVRGWRYSGWSKWPLCAVNIFTIRMGSLLAWREGSDGDGKGAGVWAGRLSAPPRRGSPLESVALRSREWLRKSGSAPAGGSLIWFWTHAGSEAGGSAVQFLLPGHFVPKNFNSRQCGNPKQQCAMRVLRVGPELSLEDQITKPSSLGGIKIH